MPYRPTGRTTRPEDLPLPKVLAELMIVLVRLLALEVIAWVGSVVWPQARDASSPAAATQQHRIHAMPPLRWRGPWWAWQLLAWAIATVTAPTFLIVGCALLLNAHSDHPLFWWSLPVIVAIGNAIAIVCINQQHYRQPFAERQTLARRHVVVGGLVGAALFLLVGLVSGFLPEVALPLSNAANTTFPAFTGALCNAGLAVAFAALSFSHAGAVHAGIGFRMAAAWPRLHGRLRQDDRSMPAPS